MRDNIVAGIDVGSSKICTLVAEVTPDEDLRVLGVGITPAQGVKKGMVDDIQKATDAIASSVERAERSSGSRILSAHVSIGGNHTTSLNNRGISPASSARSRRKTLSGRWRAPSLSACRQTARYCTTSRASSS
jgi:cell division protein FtsA